jgi:glycosyltransferase involved in cell wall biosynthesis
MKPAITVLMSCYNSEKWLAESIESILAQTFENFEFLIIDDGSEDNTPDILAHYQQIDPRIRVISKPNTGLPDSLNVGIAQAQGQWIARLDADDLSEPRRLERQLNFVTHHPALVLVGSASHEIDERGDVYKANYYPIASKSLKQHLRYSKRFFPHSSAFFCTATVRRIGGYRSRFLRSQDWDLWLRLSEGNQIACLQEPLVCIRRHASQISYQGSATRSINYGHAATIAYWLRKYDSFDPGAFEDQEKWQEFYKWVSLRVEQEGCFDDYQAWSRLRAEILLLNQSLGKVVAALGKLLIVAHPGRMLWQKMFGSNLSKALAKEWGAKRSASGAVVLNFPLAGNRCFSLMSRLLHHIAHARYMMK